MKEIAPAGVELPRSVVAGFLSEALAVRAKRQSESRFLVDLTSGDGAMELALSMELGGGFCPVYKLPLVPVGGFEEQQQKRSLVVEMEAQIADLKRQIRELSV